MEFLGTAIIGPQRPTRDCSWPWNPVATIIGSSVCNFSFSIHLFLTWDILVARKVSENVSAGQCQNRWQKTLNPMLRKGTWTEEEDERLRKSVAGYGSSWIQVATAIPGRTNDQCRERWTEHVNNACARTLWSPEEDKMLLDLVQNHGNQWKVISLQIGNNKTGQNVSTSADLSLSCCNCSSVSVALWKT